MSAKKTKVFILHNYLTPYRLGVFAELNKELDLTVYFCSRRPPERRWQASPERYRFSYRILPHRRWFKLIINYSLPVEILRERADVYIAGDDPWHFLSTWIVWLKAKATGRPFVLWSETIEEDHFKFSRHRASVISRPLIKLLLLGIRFHRKLLYQTAAGFMAYSKRAKNYLCQHGVDRKRIVAGAQVVPSELTPLVKVAKNETGFKNKKVVLTVCYLRKGKGVDYLIKAYQKLSLKDTVLVIVGDGPDKSRLLKLSGDREDILFMGHLDGQEKAKMYLLADIFVLPTLQDAWGLVVNEAMYYGLPVVVTKEAACVDYLIRGNGIVVEAGNVNQLAESLGLLLGDEKRRKEMGQRSKMIIRQFTAATGTRPFLKVIRYVRQSPK